jgi:hypothetical protein
MGAKKVKNFPTHTLKIVSFFKAKIRTYRRLSNFFAIFVKAGRRRADKLDKEKAFLAELTHRLGPGHVTRPPPIGEQQEDEDEEEMRLRRHIQVQ